MVKGYNSHNGFYNVYLICDRMIKLVSKHYDVQLPDIKHWFLQRIDIAICYNLKNNEDVKTYINNISMCQYPRRNVVIYRDEGIYLKGTTTTLKIYNKLLEFKNNDMKKLKSTKFNTKSYLKRIQGFIRFECEIKKKKLEEVYGTKYIRIRNVNYQQLENIWKQEFMKLLKLFDTHSKIINNRSEVEKILYSLYNKRNATLLYNFYLSIIVDGIQEVKKRMSKSTYYRNIKELKKCNIDFSQIYRIELKNEVVKFNPFKYREIK